MGTDILGVDRMSYGRTTVYCIMCERKLYMHGWLPFARQIWANDEGLICCYRQTVIIAQTQLSKLEKIQELQRSVDSIGSEEE